MLIPGRKKDLIPCGVKPSFTRMWIFVDMFRIGRFYPRRGTFKVTFVVRGDHAMKLWPFSSDFSNPAHLDCSN